MQSIVQKIAILSLFLLGSIALMGQTQGPTSRNQLTSCPMYIPNAFTPNGDNLNELFTVKHGEDCEMQKYNIKIFDRWGRLVFEANSIKESDSWDGRMEGNELQQGVYMYKIHAVLVNLNHPSEKHIENRQGSVVLIR